MIGISGLGKVEGTIFHGTYKKIRDAFPHAEILDATRILTEVRYIKSPEEIEVLTRSIQENENMVFMGNLTVVTRSMS